MSTENPKNIVHGLIALFILTWLSSFIPVGFEFASYSLILLYLLAGIALIVSTSESRTRKKAKRFLFLTGFASTLLATSIIIGMLEFKGYYIFYEILKQALSTQIDLFVVTVLALAASFWIGAIGSIVLLNKVNK